MAFLLNSSTKASLNVKMKDTDLESVSRTYNGVYPFADLTKSINPPAGAPNPTTANSVADLLDKAGRAIKSLTLSTYVDSNFTVTQSMKEILAG